MKAKLIFDGCKSVTGIRYGRHEETVSLIILDGERAITLEMDWREAQKMGERLVAYAGQALEHVRRGRG